MKNFYTCLRMVLLVVVITLVASCKGQSKSDTDTLDTPNLQVQTNTTIGTIVTTIDNRIWVVFQDSNSNYWFGSNGKGLYHYDGKELRLITTEHGLVDNTIRGIQEDSFGTIFIETSEGISKYNGTSFTTLKPIVSPNNKWKLESTDLWFGYNANDLYRYAGDSLFELKLPRQDLTKAFGREVARTPFESNNFSPYGVYGIDQDKDGNIWIGTVTAGAFRYDGISFIWIAEKELTVMPNGAVPGVRSMIQDKDGFLWLSNFKNRYKIESNSQTYEKLSGAERSEGASEEKGSYFNSGLSDVNGDLWMTTYGGGVWKYDGTTISNIEVKNDTEDVLLISIFQDNEGVLWLGSDNDGIYKGNGVSFKKFEPNLK